MALIKCKECGKEMSGEAAACPACGKPNVAAKKKEMDGKQGMGCLLFLVGGGLLLFFPMLGLPVLVVGLVIALLNTRAV